jgi:flagellar motor switch protein FliG
MGVSDNFIAMLQKMSDSFIQDNIYMVGRPLLAKALKNIEPQYQDKVLRNMTGEGAEDVRKLMADQHISTEDSEAAQRELISMAQGYF